MGEQWEEEEKEGKETKRVASTETAELTEDGFWLSYHEITLPQSITCAIPEHHKDRETNFQK